MMPDSIFDQDFQQSEMYGDDLKLESGRNGPFIWTKLTTYLTCKICNDLYDMRDRPQLKVGSRCQRLFRKKKAKNSNEFAENHGQPAERLCQGTLERVGSICEKVPISEISQAIAHEMGDETERGRSLHFKWFTERGAHVRRNKIKKELER